MPPVAVIEKIRAQAQEVFDFIGHVETHPQIADFSQSVKIISEKKTGVGTRFHQVYTSGAEHVSEMMVWEPYKKIVWHNFEDDSTTPVMIISYYFEEEGPYTHILPHGRVRRIREPGQAPRRHAEEHQRARESEEDSGGGVGKTSMREAFSCLPSVPFVKTGRIYATPTPSRIRRDCRTSPSFRRMPESRVLSFVFRRYSPFEQGEDEMPVVSTLIGSGFRHAPE